MIFIQHPDNDIELTLADRLGEYLTQQLQLYYSETVLVQTNITLTHTQIDWLYPYFVYEFIGNAVMTLPYTRSEDITELQRLQEVTLANTVALHAFWNDTPLLWYLPPPEPVDDDETIMDDAWIWIVIALVAFGGVFCIFFVAWRIWHHRPLPSQQPSQDPVKSVATLPNPPPQQDEEASIAWSTPMGKVIPASFYLTARTPSQDDESLTQTPSMSASPIRGPVHQFETDSILMDGYYSDPENENDEYDDDDDDDPASPPRPRKAKNRAFPQPPPPPSLHSDLGNDPQTMASTTNVDTESLQSARSHRSSHQQRRVVYKETKPTLFPDDTSLPSDEERLDQASVSAEQDVLGHYLRRKRG